MIYVTGDTHGKRERLINARLPWGVGDYVIVCGDFGFIFFDDEPENRFLDELENRPFTVCFVDGNHENFDVIYRYPEEEWMGGRIHRIRKNIVHLMRGQVFELEGKTLFTMGGAYSVDKASRTENESWWQQEKPVNEEYREATANLKAHNNSVDYILTHNAPTGIIMKMGYHPDHHDAELTGYLDYLMNEIEHKHWYCGHWHTDKDFSEKFTALWFDVREIT